MVSCSNKDSTILRCKEQKVLKNEAVYSKYFIVKMKYMTCKLDYSLSDKRVVMSSTHNDATDEAHRIKHKMKFSHKLTK
jgi:hypothetical protein